MQEWGRSKPVGTKSQLYKMAQVFSRLFLCLRAPLTVVRLYKCHQLLGRLHYNTKKTSECFKSYLTDLRHKLCKTSWGGKEEGIQLNTHPKNMQRTA